MFIKVSLFTFCKFTSCFFMQVSPLGSVHSQPEVTHHQDPEIELSIDDSRIDGMHFKQDLTASSFVDHVMSHRSTLYFLSGISKNAFESLFIVLTENSAPIPSSCLSVQDQLLLTLCRYKHNFCHPLLKALFRSEINEIEVLNIFTFWTYHMYKKLMQYLAESVKLKNTGRMCLRVDVVRVPALKELPHQSKKEEFGDNSFLKSLVVIDTDNKAVLYCSQFYHATYGAMMQDSEFLECVAPSSLIKEDGSLNLSQLFPDKIIEIVCSDNYSVCPYLSEHGQSGSSPFSHFVKSKRSQCFVDTFKMLSDGLTMDISLMASQIMFNCMMLLNINENLSNT